MDFVFYDTETTGTDTSFDQILQFAAIHTDADFNELERFEIRCRLLRDTVPAPGAMRVTRLTAAQLKDPSLPSHYEMIRRILEKFEEWSPAIFVGYNSIAFDEQLLRHALYKTLHSPYVTNTKGNARTDAMRMVQAAALLAPKALAIPTDESGRAVFKLDRVAPANGFKHDLAHDALADVEATIFLCRLLSARAPKIWSSFMRFSKKAAVARYMVSESSFCLVDCYFGRHYSWLVTTIGSNTENTSEFYVFDLAVDPASLSQLTDVQLAARLGQSPKPLRRVRTNAAPIILPAEEAPPITSALRVGKEEIDRRMAFLGSDNGLLKRIVATFESTKDKREPSPYVERQLYDGFFSDADQRRMEQFHDTCWEERGLIVDQFEDCRLQEVGRRLIGIERPDLLSEADRASYERAVAERVLGIDAEAPWLILPKAIPEITEMLISATGEEAELLHGHRQYLIERSEEAMSHLDVGVAGKDTYGIMEDVAVTA
jgi:exodeoxyribonuclease-1